MEVELELVACRRQLGEDGEERRLLLPVKVKVNEWKSLAATD